MRSPNPAPRKISSEPGWLARQWPAFTPSDTGTGGFSGYSPGPEASCSFRVRFPALDSRDASASPPSVHSLTATSSASQPSSCLPSLATLGSFLTLAGRFFQPSSATFPKSDRLCVSRTTLVTLKPLLVAWATETTPVLSVKATLLGSAGSGLAPTSCDDDHKLTMADFGSGMPSGGASMTALVISCAIETGPSVSLRGWK